MAIKDNLSGGGGVKYGTIDVNQTTSGAYTDAKTIDLTGIDGYENIVSIGIVDSSIGTWTTDGGTSHDGSIFAKVAHTKGNPTAQLWLRPSGRTGVSWWRATLLYVIDANA